METVQLKPFDHHGQECIGIYFENNAKINGALRKNAAAKWSRTHKCWYVPLSKENNNKIFFAVKGLAVIDQSALHQYLDKREKQPGAMTVPVIKHPVSP